MCQENKARGGGTVSSGGSVSLMEEWCVNVGDRCKVSKFQSPNNILMQEVEYIRVLAC